MQEKYERLVEKRELLKCDCDVLEESYDGLKKDVIVL